MLPLNTRIIDLTVGELLEVIEKGSNQPRVIIDTTKGDKKYVYGLNGIARLFGCSRTTAYRIKASGKINKAIKQIGNTIVVDGDLALELINKKK